MTEREKPAGLRIEGKIADSLSRSHPSVRFSETDLGFLSQFENNETDGITCWRSDTVQRRTGSKIEGLGLFSVEDTEVGLVIAIKPGRLVGRNTIRDKSEITRGSHQQIDSNTFLTGLTEEEVDKNLVGYNHSCDPNAKIILLEGVPLALLVAKKDIKKGEEITTDYAQSQVSNTHRMFECNCGSSNCREIIDPGSDWMIESIQKAHKGDFPWFIQENIDAVNAEPDSELKGRLRVILTVRMADAVNLLATDLEEVDALRKQTPLVIRLIFRQMFSKYISEVERSLSEAVRKFAIICSLVNIDDMGVNRNDPASIEEHKQEIIQFARQLDKIFN